MVSKSNYKFKNKPLPDILAYGLKVLFIGYNPGILSAKSGHHYAHKSNRFWKLLYESGLTPNKLNAEEDRKLLELGFGSTNIVDRPSKSSGEINPEELRSGSKELYKLINGIKPMIACFVGIGVYRAYTSSILGVSPSKISVNTGAQENRIIDCTLDFVCSNPSGLNTIPYSEQLGCFIELRKLLE
jgi:double-stranded uracil-DNA glycosylase